MIEHRLINNQGERMMVYIRYLALLIISITALSSVSIAQSFEIPCGQCPQTSISIYPESGNWYIPGKPGSGISLEVQNGELSGFYYGYSEIGLPVWYMFSGNLLESSEADQKWTIKADLLQLNGGSCINCEYQVVKEAIVIGQISMIFKQRSLASFSIDDAPWQSIIPFTYGISGSKLFPEVTDFVMPDIESHPWNFVFTRKEQRELEAGSSNVFFNSTLTLYFFGLDSYVENPPGKAEGFRASLIWEDNPSEILFEGILYCDTKDSQGNTLDGVLCRLERNVIWSDGDWVPDIYYFPLGNITDSRISGETTNGDTFEAFKVRYN